MNSYAFFYIEANFICIVFLLILLIRTLRGVDLQLKQIIFARTLFFYVIYCLIDIVWILFECGIFKGYKVHFVFNLISYVIGSVSTFYWFIYSETVEGNKYVFSRKNRIKIAIPIEIFMVLSIAFIFIIGFIKIPALKKGFYFYYYLITSFTPLLYAIPALICSISRALKKENSDKKNLYIIMGFYPVVIFIGCFFQIRFLHIPIVCFVVSLALLCVYLSSLSELVSVDALTKLNNRNEFNNFVKRSVRNGDSKKWVFFIDVDKFKSINDNYGHLEGDKALILVAEALKISCKNAPNKYFLARYGGDEFIIVANPEDVYDSDEFKTIVSSNLNEYCYKANLKYNLSVSIGASLVDFNKDSIENCLKQADKRLYIEKKSKKNKIKVLIS